MRGRRAGWTALVAVGVVAVLAGVLVLRSRAAAQAGFGWFAYAPPSEDQLAGLVAVNGPRAAGGGLLCVGLVLLAVAVGQRAGRGRPARPRPVVLPGAVLVAVLAVVAGGLAVALPRSLVTVGGGAPYGPSGPGWSFPTTVWSPPQVAGAGLVLLGVLLLAAVAGWRRAVGASGHSDARHAADPGP